MNKYLSQIEKQSSLGLAAAAHIAQNAATNHAIRSGKLGGIVGHHLTEGYYGTKVGIKDKVKTGLLSIVSPEAAVLKTQARGVGEWLGDKTIKAGKPITSRELVVARHIANGNFDKAARRVGQTPRLSELAKEYSDKHGVSLGNPSLKKALKVLSRPKVTKEWHSDRNPILNKVLPAVFNQTRKSALSASKHGAGHKAKGAYTSMMAANAGVSVADPITSGINVGKAFLSSPAAQKNKYLHKMVHYVEDKAVKDPIKASFKSGLLGQKSPDTFKEKAKGVVNRFGVNALADHVSTSAKNIGLAINDSAKKQGTSMATSTASTHALSKLKKNPGISKGS